MSDIYKTVNVYANPQDTLFIIPSSFLKNWGNIPVDLVAEMQAPYTDEELEAALMCAVEQCDSIPPDEDINSPHLLERYFNKKGYARLVKDKRLIDLKWRVKEGYTVEPTKKCKKPPGYEGIEDQYIKLALDFKPGELAQAFRKAMLISFIEV